MLAAKGLESAVQATEHLASETLTLQRTTGLAAEQASGLIAVAAALGVSTDKLNIGFGLLAKNIVNGATNFEKYNVATTDANGNQLDLIQILGNVSDQYQKVGGGLNGAALAMNIFGRSGKALIPILQQGRAGIAEMLKQADAFGLVIGQDTVDNVFKLQVATRELGESFKGFEVQVGVALIPVLTTFVGVFTDLVGVLHLIPPVALDVGAGFLILSGALVAIVAAAKAIGGAFATVQAVLTGSATATTLQAEATAAQLAASEALAATIPELTAALQALAAVQAEVAGSATAAAVALEAEAAAAAAAIPEEAAAGAALAGAGAGEAAAGLGALSALLSPVALGIGAVTAGFVLFKVAVDGAHKAFSAGIEQDLLALEAGGAHARRMFSAAQTVRNLAASLATLPATLSATKTAGGVPAVGLRGNVLAFQASQADQATQALARYNQIQDTLTSSTKDLTGAITASVRAVADQGEQATLSQVALDKLNTVIGRSGAGLDKFNQLTGVDATGVLASFQDAVVKAAGSLPKLQDAATTALASAKAAFSDWHDSIVASLGGAGTALDRFAGKTNVDLSKAVTSIDRYTTQIQRFGGNIAKISDTFGKKANAFIQWATQQGLAQQGLVASVANANDKNAKSFVDAFNTGQSATDTLANAIQDTLGKAFEAMITKLSQIKRALLGLPQKVDVKVDVTADTSQASAQIAAFLAKLKAAGLQVSAGALQLAAHGWAEGFHGTIDRPTLAIIGEKGSERVDVTPVGQMGPAGSGRIHGQLAITDWHRGIASLTAEQDQLDRTSGR